MLLDHTGLPEASARIHRAVQRALDDPANRRADLGGSGSTARLATAILNGLEASV